MFVYGGSVLFMVFWLSSLSCTALSMVPVMTSSAVISSSTSFISEVFQQPQETSTLAILNHPTSSINQDTMGTTTIKMIQAARDQNQQGLSNLKPRVVYTIAGSDSGGGAGIQTDLHTIRAFGCHGCTAITCLTAQNSQGVTAIHAPPIAFFHQQWDALIKDIVPDAIKIGMLGTKDLANAVGMALAKLNTTPAIPIVLDPVMISTSGSRLLDPDAEAALKAHVFPFVDVLTPNKFEAEALLRRKLVTKQDVEDGARELLAMLKSDGASVLIKGGHSNETNSYAQDYLLTNPHNNNNNNIHSKRNDNEDDDDKDDGIILPRLCDSTRRCGIWLRSPRYDTIHTHGTGCTLSSAIAAALANGRNIVDACCLAKAYVSAGIEAARPIGKGPGPVAHGRAIRADQFPIIPLNDDDDDMEDTSFQSLTDLGKILPIVDSLEWIQRLCAASTANKGARIRDVQLRIKGVTNSTLIEEIVKQSQQACARANIRLWVNDYWRAAIQSGCFGVHLGQEDLYQCVAEGGIGSIRKANMALGISTHSFGELAAALGVRPSYISLGPVFATASKNVQFDPQGLETVQIWRQLIPTSMPLVAIGGINTVDRVAQIKGAGADCAAVIGAVTQHYRDPTSLATVLAELNHAMDT